MSRRQGIYHVSSIRLRVSELKKLWLKLEVLTAEIASRSHALRSPTEGKGEEHQAFSFTPEGAHCCDTATVRNVYFRHFVFTRRTERGS